MLRGNQTLLPSSPAPDREGSLRKERKRGRQKRGTETKSRQGGTSLRDDESQKGRIGAGGSDHVKAL